MLLKSLKSVPLSYTEKTLLLLSSALGVLLELAGLAVLVPLLLLLLENKGITSNKYLKPLYDTIGIEDYGSFLLVVIAFVLLFIILKNILLHKFNNYRNAVLLKLYAHYTRNLFFGYYSRGLSFIKQNSPTILSHNVNGICFQYVFGVLNPLLIMAGDLLLSVLIIISLGFLNFYIAAIELVLFAPLILFYHLKIGGELQKAGKADNEAKKNQWQVTNETFRGYADVVVNNFFPLLSKRFSEGIAAVSASKMQVERLRSLASKYIEISVILMITGVVVVYYFFAGEVSGFRTFMGIFVVATLRLLPAVRSMIAQHSTLRNNQYTIEFINEATEVTRPLPDIDFTFKHTIELKNISFSFGPDRPIFKNLSLTIHQGEQVGIRGVSGSGKSTLLYLIMGLYEPQEGSVLIDGIELNPENRSGWHKLIGYVSQDVFIMDSTLGNNISSERVTDSKLLDRSIDISALRELTGKLPDGISTMIGESGSRLSGGERQRIGIARAYFKRAEVLLMDEPTSSLDAKTEEEITETLGQLLSENRTIIIISHRESLLSKCDRIIDFEKLQEVIA
jgi:ABC-type multidrug transport system fused ATPase/permease subunit